MNVPGGHGSPSIPRCNRIGKQASAPATPFPFPVRFPPSRPPGLGGSAPGDPAEAAPAPALVKAQALGRIHRGVCEYAGCCGSGRFARAGGFAGSALAWRTGTGLGSSCPPGPLCFGALPSRDPCGFLLSVLSEVVQGRMSFQHRVDLEIGLHDPWGRAGVHRPWRVRLWCVEAGVIWCLMRNLMRIWQSVLASGG